MFTSEFAIRFIVDIKSAVSAKALLKFWVAVSVSAFIVLSSDALLSTMSAGASVTIS